MNMFFSRNKKNISKLQKEIVNIKSKINYDIANDLFKEHTLSTEFVDKIYDLLNDDNYVYGVHMTSDNSIASTIYDKGLRLTGHSIDTKNIDLSLNINFRENNNTFDKVMLLANILRSSGYKNSSDFGYGILVKIPKSDLEVGKNAEDVNIKNSSIIYNDNNNTYLKPKYIVAKIEVDKNKNINVSGNTWFKDNSINISEEYIRALYNKYEDMLKEKNDPKYIEYMSKKLSGIDMGNLYYDTLESRISNVSGILSNYYEKNKTANWIDKGNEIGTIDEEITLREFANSYVNEKYPLTKEDFKAIANDETTPNIDKRNEVLKKMEIVRNNLLSKQGEYFEDLSKTYSVEDSQRFINEAKHKMIASANDELNDMLNDNSDLGINSIKSK